ncbi:MAG: DeoR faimly transcriptional regulator [Peptococcaceae bacterium BRH_c4b]|nr:MAG: DeoR faimly transcriptional regulator [Peptococcaceae bacterium BRH_c4b]
MSREALCKAERHDILSKYINGNPFLTDDDLAHILGVSIQTIRLDRAEMNIPELRIRLKKVAREVYGQVRSLSSDEFVGELVALEVGREGISVLTVGRDMLLSKSEVARGQLLYAQANTLAVALIDTEVALTGTAKISYKRPVFSGEKVVARAFISRKKGNKYMVRVSSKVRDEIVFQGKFLVFAIEEEVWRR